MLSCYPSIAYPEESAVEAQPQSGEPDDGPGNSAEQASPRRPRRPELVINGALTMIWLSLLPSLWMDPVKESQYGPVFRGPEDVEALLDAAEHGTLGRVHVNEESITDTELIWALFGGFAGAALVGIGLAPLIDSGDQNGRWYLEQGLAFLLGFAHTLFGTELLTEVAKHSVGRLRPDFADRADRYYCYQDSIPSSYQSRCDDLRTRGELRPAVGEASLIRGRQSFWSGHSALSMAAMTYASLYIGGRMVWGETANALTRTIGILCQGAAMTAAVFIAQSRISDGVHHVEDVWVGTAVGFAIAQLSYWLNFDRRGEVRQGLSLQAGVTNGGVAAGVSGRF